MTTTKYVAFLRGINVGGNNIIKMAELKACLTEAGFIDVVTYIQSGNVIFTGPKTDAEKLGRAFADALTKQFRYSAPIVVRSHQEMKDIAAAAPKGFGSQPDIYRYNVIYLKEPLTPHEAMQSISTKEGVDEAAAGPHVLYFSNLIAKATQSQLNRIIQMPVYKNMTIRNWNTTTKVLALMEKQLDVK